MLYSFLLALLVVATLALFAIGAVLAHQQRIEIGQRRSRQIRGFEAGFGDDETPVRLGELGNEISQAHRDEHALAKLQLEAQARRKTADIIG